MGNKRNQEIEKRCTVLVGEMLTNWCRRAVGFKRFRLCATPTFLKGFWPNFHRSFVIKCPGTYCQYFVIRTFLTEFWPFVVFLNIAEYTSVHDSYISQGILTRLSQKLCHQVPWRILSVFCDSNIFGGIMALWFFKI